MVLLFLRLAIPELSAPANQNSLQNSGLLAFYGQNLPVNKGLKLNISINEKTTIRGLSSIEKQTQFYPRINIVANQQVTLGLFKNDANNFDSETQLFKVWNKRDGLLTYQGAQQATYVETQKGDIVMLSHTDYSTGSNEKLITISELIGGKMIHQVNLPVNPINQNDDLSIFGEIIPSPTRDRFAVHLLSASGEHFIGFFNNFDSDFEFLIQVKPFDKIVFSPSGNYLAINSNSDNIFHIYDSKSGALQFTTKPGKAGKGFAFNNQENYLITNGRENDVQYISIWDWKNKQIYRTFNMQSLDEIMFILPMNYANILILGSRLGTVQFFDLDSEKVVSTFNYTNNDSFNENPYSNFGLAISENEKSMVTINSEGLIKIWDLSIK